jgi:hypothetical protein
LLVSFAYLATVAAKSFAYFLFLLSQNQFQTQFHYILFRSGYRYKFFQANNKICKIAA